MKASVARKIANQLPDRQKKEHNKFVRNKAKELYALIKRASLEGKYSIREIIKVDMDEFNEDVVRLLTNNGYKVEKKDSIYYSIEW